MVALLANSEFDRVWKKVVAGFQILRLEELRKTFYFFSQIAAKKGSPFSVLRTRHVN
jgi:hypothetical protein